MLKIKNLNYIHATGELLAVLDTSNPYETTRMKVATASDLWLLHQDELTSLLRRARAEGEAGGDFKARSDVINAFKDIISKA